MIDLLSLHKLFLSMHIKKGDTVADFTMGGGGDTLWLSNAVGESGKVYAFDVQPMALEKTRARLQSEHAPENYTLILDSHSNLKNYIHEPIRAGVFNLGWLPGSDKTVTTLRETTRKAVVDALSILGEDGVLLVAVYPGHEEGEKRAKCWASCLLPTPALNSAVPFSVSLILPRPLSSISLKKEKKSACDFLTEKAEPAAFFCCRFCRV